MGNLTERYAFIPVPAWETVIDSFPNAVSYGDSKLIQYASPEDSDRMMQFVIDSGLEFVHYTRADSDMIMTAINAGIDKIYNCDYETALEVASNFMEASHDS